MLLDFLTWPTRSWRRMRQIRPIRFTRFGSFYVFFSLAVGAAAINTGNNLLYFMLGLLLGFIIISGILSDSSLWGLRVRFEPVGDLYVGQPAAWDVTATKNGFPAVAARVEAVWEPNRMAGEAFFFWVPRNVNARQRLTLTPPHRGRLTVRSLRYATRFPFGLFEKSYQGVCGEQWIVFPAVRLLPVSFFRAAGMTFSDQPSDRKGVGSTPFDMRSYQPGDASKRIHWKSSAKRGVLMVTEMEEESGMTQRIVVPAWPAKETEAFISFVASLVYSLNRMGQRVGLRTPGAAFEPDLSRAQLKNILTCLALVNPGSEPASSAKTVGRALDALALWGKFRDAR